MLRHLRILIFVLNISDHFFEIRISVADEEVPRIIDIFSVLEKAIIAAVKELVDIYSDTNTVKMVFTAFWQKGFVKENRT